MAAELPIRVLWDGALAPAAEHACVRIALSGSELVVDVDAPWHGDRAPPGPAGSTEALWEHEVVELFLLGADDRYLEVELGPHGHYLVIEHRGYRNRTRQHLPIRYQAMRHGDRWRGQARVPHALVPAALARANAYSIHAAGTMRRFLACFAVPGPAPDFHRLERFGPIELR